MNTKPAQNIFFFLFVLINSLCSAQFNRLSIRNYTRNEYGKNQASDNWGMVQGKDGRMYVGSSNGVLEYDGNKWGFIPVKEGSYVLSLARDSAGTIFVGAQKEFGFLKCDQPGKLVYHSLSDSLPEKDRQFTNIFMTYATAQEVFFQCDENIFVFRNGKTTIVSPATSFHTSFVVNKEFYVRQRGSGLMKLKDGFLVLIDIKGVFRDIGIFAMMPYDNTGKILIVTREKGLYIYDPSDPATPFLKRNTDIDELLISCGIEGGIRLHDGLFALNTIENGVILMDAGGHLISIINQDMGLRVNDVKGILEDDQHNIWLTLSNGISKATYGSPLSRYAEESGLKGNINDILMVDCLLYIATSSGLFVKQKKEGLPHFIPATSIQNQVWGLSVIRKELVAGTNDGFYVIQNLQAKKVMDLPQLRSFSYAPEQDLLLAGNAAGMYLISKNWKVLDFFDSINNIVRIEKEEPEADGSSRFIVASRTNGTFRVEITPGLKIKMSHMGFPPSVEGELLLPFRLGKKIVFATNEGLLQYTRGQKEKMEWISEYQQKGITAPISLVNESLDKIWLSISNQPAYLDKKTRILCTQPFLSIDAGKINVIYPESDCLCCIGADDALILYDGKVIQDYDKSFPVLITRMTTAKDSLLYAGHTASASPSFTLPYAFNQVVFEFAAPYFEENSKIQYIYQLKGSDTTWSVLSGETKAVFQNLKEGAYTFTVKAVNIYGKYSRPASIHFVIRPPWYRTPVSYLGYALFLAGFIYLIVIINSKRLRDKNASLEKIIKLRTAEIVEKNINLEKQNIQIANQKQEITDSINYSKRIQDSVLPPLVSIKSAFPDSFVFYKPKNIISGDFYFFADFPEGCLIAAADCTGHGVPGAIMSVIGSEKLTEALQQTHSPGNLLQLASRGLKKTLRQNKEEDSTRDGMDIALCYFDNTRRILEYSGANRPLWIIRKLDTTLTEFKATKTALGGLTDDNQEFETHRIQLSAGDTIYLSSDGFADQFGARDKKLMTKKFRELLLSIQEKAMEEQGKVLEAFHQEWKGTLEQTDDILVIGIRV